MERTEKNMKKKLTLLILSAMLLALCPPVWAQQPKKVPRIGYLATFDRATESVLTEAIQGALRELGYIEGQNIASEYRYADGKRNRFPELASDLVRLRVDIIVVVGGADMIQAAKNATKTISIVMVGRGVDPVKQGFVESLGRPGSNVTGLTNLSAELAGKQLELLKEAVPKLSRVAVVYDPAVPGSVLRVKEVLPPAARALGLTIQSWEVRDASEFDRVFAALNKERPDRILKETRPADLPVEQPTKFELVINLKTAKQIGLTIPQSMLYRADKVIK
jgi:putative ABC transport system substrate-binding protein